MDKVGRGLRSGRYPAVLYANNTDESKNMQKLLDSTNAIYELADAEREGLPGPRVVVNGCFLDYNSLVEILT